jgi:hypothetical protein
MQGVKSSVLYHVAHAIRANDEDCMALPMLKFPPLDTWQRMDESQQDALIDRIEIAQQWRRLGMRALIAVACGAACFGIGALAALL